MFLAALPFALVGVAYRCAVLPLLVLLAAAPLHGVVTCICSVGKIDNKGSLCKQNLRCTLIFFQVKPLAFFGDEHQSFLQHRSREKRDK